MPLPEEGNPENVSHGQDISSHGLFYPIVVYKGPASLPAKEPSPSVRFPHSLLCQSKNQRASLSAASSHSALAASSLQAKDTLATLPTTTKWPQAVFPPPAERTSSTSPSGAKATIQGPYPQLRDAKSCVQFATEARSGALRVGRSSPSVPTSCRISRTRLSPWAKLLAIWPRPSCYPGHIASTAFDKARPTPCAPGRICWQHLSSWEGKVGNQVGEVGGGEGGHSHRRRQGGDRRSHYAGHLSFGVDRCCAA